MKTPFFALAAVLFATAWEATPAFAQHASRGRDHRRTAVRPTTRTRVVVARRPARAVVQRRAHVHYVGLPRWGASFTALPTAVVSITFGGNNYQYANGVYYLHRNAGYVVARPVRGVRVPEAPPGLRPVVVGPRTYY